MGSGCAGANQRHLRDELVAALGALSARAGKHVFTVREVYAEMVARDTAFAKPSVFQDHAAVRKVPIRPPSALLERDGRAGFWLAETAAAPRPAVTGCGRVGGLTLTWAVVLSSSPRLRPDTRQRYMFLT